MSSKKMNKISTINEYFDAQPENTKKALLELQECILKVAPNAIQMINYNIPAYELIKGGKRETQIMIGANKTSVGLYPHPTTMEKFESELSSYKRGKGAVQFPINQPLPTELIIKMVAYRFNMLNTSNLS